jgi:hypothetical protein
VSDFLNSETGWLNLTNAVLGIVVLVCLVVVGRAVIKELYVRAAKRSRMPLEHDKHAFSLQSLGITMADGGEAINENKDVRIPSQPDIVDPPNIVRSDN